MKTLKIKKIFILSTWIIYGIQGFAETYTVKRGDVLSSILYSKNLKPIYGKDGTLLKVIKINNELKASRGNHIFPKMKINLSIHDTENSPVAKIESPALSERHDVLSGEVDSTIDTDRKETQTNCDSLKLEQEKPSSRNFSQGGNDLGIDLLSEFIRIKATDHSNGAIARLISDATTGYRLSWGQHWSKDLRSFLSFQSARARIEDSSSTTKTLTNRENTLTQYQIGIDYQYAPRLKIVNTLMYGESLVSRSMSSTVITIEKFRAPSVAIGFEYKIHEIGHLSLRAVGAVSAVLPAEQGNYKSKLSLGKKLGIGLGNAIGDFRISGEVYYQNTDLEMIDASYSQTSIGMMIGVKREFGGNW